MDYDIAVIGGGPAGYSAALKAAQLGARVVLFEADNVGGTCLNAGCIPTKCYVAKAELIEGIKRSTENGILKEAGLFSFRKIHEEKQRVVDKLRSGVASLLKGAGVDTINAQASPGDRHTVLAGGKQYTAEKMILCTGSANYLPDIPGIKGRNVTDSTGLLALEKVPEDMVVIGAGVIGLELASAFSAFGAKVTLVDILPAILPGEEQEAAYYIGNCMKKEGITFRLDSKVIEIGDSEGKKCVIIKNHDSTEKLLADNVLVAVGRAPNNALAKELGLALDTKGFVSVNEKMQTSVPGIYAAGDITGGYLLAHSAYAEGETAAINCCGGDESADLSVMPRCIFTIPQLAAVGLTEAQAKERFAVTTGVFPFAASGKSLAEGSGQGFVKTVAEKETGRLLGCTIVGHDAAELISTAAVAVHTRVTVSGFERIILPHPTLSESIKEAILDNAGHAIHIPLRKK